MWLLVGYFDVNFDDNLFFRILICSSEVMKFDENKRIYGEERKRSKRNWLSLFMFIVRNDWDIFNGNVRFFIVSGNGVLS